MKKNEKKKLANEIYYFLLTNDLWMDVDIYFDGKCYSSHDKSTGKYYYNDPKHLIVTEDEPPFNYVNPDTISMSFEGALYHLLNGYIFDNTLLENFNKIFSKYNLFYELGNAWNLTCYNI